MLSKHSLLNVYMSPSKQAALSERKDHVLTGFVCVCVCVCVHARVCVCPRFFFGVTFKVIYAHFRKLRK